MYKYFKFFCRKRRHIVCTNDEELKDCVIEKEKEIRKYYKKHFHEFQRLHRFLIYFKPGIFVLNLFVIYLLFKWIGMQSVGLFLVILLLIKEVGQFIFLHRLEKRILNPIVELKSGVDEIANGNYNVHVECSVQNEIGTLVESFNDMAKKLYEGEKLKNEYEENRKMLIANISHDLKTPITSIQGYIEALQDSSSVPPESLGKYLQVIYRNTAYMNNLIDDLFLFSKLDLHKLEFNFQKVRIKRFMADLMEEFKFDLEEKHVDFKYKDNVKEDIQIDVDGKRLNQAFGNIIGNAVKYSDTNHLTLDVVMDHIDSIIKISITDNGPGIPEDKLPFIFNRFYRIDHERTKDLVSTGLGLAIAKELIEAHNGTIDVWSTGEVGTTFIITFGARSHT
ncbi:HAMP domain-containing sensor histidine kinase [Pseudobacteroides cellulosolvens]|uniref:histidine kinase n=1 Tax=Pseudobacteroides cellulosolvens ATCC 35603 = DSM 2933 TaxID=398512 RepID=A0A0L6JLK7_9FIRM|nr:HAMP domain-containing sensor histidine kinase [Pseudobacteroides cellulosolvens]KNY26645.1 integral membrane sensor signal transduction histidine kinase [Pseudobacteroides cellulosolvens ATCC 35603 = DSM 2933]